jgi:hypothetical protein
MPQCEVRDDSTRHGEEKSRVAPFFQQWIFRDQDGDNAQNFPGTQDGHKIQRVAQRSKQVNFFFHPE